MFIDDDLVILLLEVNGEVVVLVENVTVFERNDKDVVGEVALEVDDMDVDVDLKLDMDVEMVLDVEVDEDANDIKGNFMVGGFSTPEFFSIDPENENLLILDVFVSGFDLKVNSGETADVVVDVAVVVVVEVDDDDAAAAAAADDDDDDGEFMEFVLLSLLPFVAIDVKKLNGEDIVPVDVVG